MSVEQKISAAIDVIMPVYNAEAFLKKAIESILKQTYSNFRLIIVDDYSTDGSVELIKTFSDPRILFHRHNENKGVVAAMNTALSSVQAPYVCVMHADDISLPERLADQKNWMDQHDDTTVLAGYLIFINEKDEEDGVWSLDRQANTRAEIRATMTKENCIAHPTVMMRSDVIKKYGYDPGQQLKGYAVEDYPLWLNLLADGYHIDKLQKPVLLYRTHPESATSSFLRKKNPFLINYFTKLTYIKERKKAKKLNSFDFRVMISLRFDYIKAQLKNLKAFFVKKHV